MNKSNINEQSAGNEADNDSTAQNHSVSQPNANTNVVGSLFSHREIKFRGKRVDNGKWVYGYIIEYLKTTWIRVTDRNKDRYFVEFEVIPESVGQFIGLYDRAGTEIFSNSILAPFGNISLKPNMDECFVVEYSKGSYNIGNESDTDYYVVGNLLENPELLQSVALGCLQRSGLGDGLELKHVKPKQK